MFMLHYYLNIVVARQHIMQSWRVKKLQGNDHVYGQKMDAGNIISQVEVPIGAEETTGELYERLSIAEQSCY